MFLVFALTAAPFAYDGTIRPGQTLAIRDINGRVHVRGGDRFSVRATRTARTSDPNEVAIHVEPRSSGVVVCVKYPPDAQESCDTGHRHGSSTHNDTTVDFEITVPRGVAVDAASVNGDVDVVTDGPVDATTVNGRVNVEGRTVHRVTTVNGSIGVKILDRPTGTLSATTVNGSIDISVPPGTGLSLYAHTMTGGIDAPGGVTVERPHYGPGATARGRVGDAAVAIRVDTVNGSIAVH